MVAVQSYEYAKKPTQLHTLNGWVLLYCTWIYLDNAVICKKTETNNKNSNIGEAISTISKVKIIKIKSGIFGYSKN